MKKKVVIIGGGVAGMSAAHELIERGFDVEVYEKQPVYLGGKARSVDVQGTGTDGRKDLPGEHGFRFFPGFYRHITDTMKRIPMPNGKKVFDNLVPTERAMLTRFDKPPITTLVGLPENLSDIGTALDTIINTDTRLTQNDIILFSIKLWQLMSSCKERRENEYERIGWWQFMEAEKQSEAFLKYFVNGLTRTLVAAKPKEISTKTAGGILLQLFYLMANPRTHADCVLNAPTNEAWLTPWHDYLVSKGVKFFNSYECSKIVFNNATQKISGAEFKHVDSKSVTLAKGNYFISAIPVEAMSKLLRNSPGIEQKDSSLSSIHRLSESVSWMTGIQYYLNQDLTLVRGHIVYPDSPWALTSISQIQFWKGFKINEFGNGEVKEILSVDISDWDTPGFNGKTAKECSKQEIKEEVWAQMKRSLMSTPGQSLLRDDMIVGWYLDRDIIFKDGIPISNEEPLLVNTVNSWTLRPEAHTGIRNFFLASDYVRTNTDLATMEGANEAARRAVNSILWKNGNKGSLCKIWELEEPDIFAIFRWADKKRYQNGLRWNNTPTGFFRSFVDGFVLNLLKLQ